MVLKILRKYITCDFEKSNRGPSGVYPFFDFCLLSPKKRQKKCGILLTVFGRIPIAKNNQKGIRNAMSPFPLEPCPSGCRCIQTKNCTLWSSKGSAIWIRTFGKTNAIDTSATNAPMLPGFAELFELDYGQPLINAKLRNTPLKIHFTLYLSG